MDKKEHCFAASTLHPTFVLNKGNAGAQPLSGYCETVSVAIKGSSGQQGKHLGTLLQHHWPMGCF